MAEMFIMLSTEDFSVPFDSVGDAFSFGLSRSVFGFATVFFILALLWGFVSLLKVFFYTIPEKRKKNKTVQNANISLPVTEDETEDEDEGIVAAIIAAIVSFRTAKGESPSGFKVVSFKKRK